MRRTFAFRFVAYCAIVLIADPRLAFAARSAGIDVSDYQGDITASEWTQIHNDGKDFAWTKATEGGGFTASTFTNNMNRGTAAGVYMGAYHYARPDLNSATTDAAHFVAVAGPYLGSGYLRPMLDIEGESWGLSTTDLSNWINTFCTYVTDRYGASADPLIYMSASRTGSEVNSSVTSHELDVASYGTNSVDPPVPTGNPSGGTGVWSTWSFWQYGSQGRVNGIGGGTANVDLDVANGDINFVRTFLIGPPPATSFERFDVNNTAGGSGVASNGSYTWEAAKFSSSSAGTDPVSWNEGNFLRLVAGTDAGANNYTITANSNHTFAGMFLQTGGGGTVNINGPGVLTFASGDQGMFVSDSTQILKVNAVIAGSSKLVWQGNGSGAGGSLYLLGNNTYSGGTLLNTVAGLNFNNDHSFGTGRITWGVAQQVLAAPTATVPITIANTMTTRSASTLIMASFAQPVTFSGAWTLATGISTLDVRSGVDSTISGNISGTDGTSALTKISPGKLTLSGSNTYAAGTTITAGTLQLGNGGTTGKLSTASTITNNSSLIFNRTNTVAQGTDFSGSAISGSGSLTQAGSGTLTLSAANTYAGKTFINAGTLSVSSDGNLGAAPGSAVADQLSFNGGTLKTTAGFTMSSNRGIKIVSSGGTFNVAAGSLGIASTITNTVGSTVAITGDGDFNPSANNSATFTNGKWTITGGSRWVNANNDNNSGAVPGSPVANFFTFDNGTYVNNSGHTLNPNKGITLAAGGGTIDTSVGNMTFNGVVTGIGSLTKISANSLSLGGANNYAGGTNLNAGTLTVSGASAKLGSGTVSVLGTTAATSLVIQSGVLDAIQDSAMLSLAGGGTADMADQGFANLGAGINEIVSSLLLGGVLQAPGLTYGSTLSGAAVQSDEYFAGTGILSVGMPGDFDDNTSVDAGDYVGWRKDPSSLGGSTGYELWRSDFGNVYSASSAPPDTLSLVEVPEPGALILAFVGCAAMIIARGRSARRVF